MYSSPVDLCPGNPRHGSAILNGFFAVLDETGERYQKSWAAPQDLFSDDEYFSSYLCRFTWLRDLKATGDMSARRLARRLIEHWGEQKLYVKTRKKLKHNEYFISAERVSNFILLYDFFGASADDSFKRVFFKNIQLEYRNLKGKLLRCSSAQISILQALIAFNVYCDYDAKFFDILLTHLLAQVHALLDEFRRYVPINQVYRNLSTMICIRNALIQWEKSFRQPRSILTQYQATFSQVQEYLLLAMQFVRFFRHSNGNLCRITQQDALCFFEPISSSEIDTTLSQIEPSEIDTASEFNGILRLSNKFSTLFADVQRIPPAPLTIKLAARDAPDVSILPNAMKFEWSYQSYDVVYDTSVAIVPGVTSLPHSLGAWNERTEPNGRAKALHVKSHGTCEYESDVIDGEGMFCGLVTDNGESYVFRREMTLNKDSLQGTDTFIVDDAISDALLILRFGFTLDWSVVEIKHEDQSLFGEVVLARVVKRSKVSCVLKIEAEQLFEINVSIGDNRLDVLLVAPLSSGIPDNVKWELRISRFH
ncbi:MAG: hypothetical protein LBR89_00975 [Holosporales bacterium]|nr:hypothetical protein [Holosporales bacterium]